MLNPFQRICAEVYANGDFAGTASIGEARSVGDTLFAFLMIELASSEGCDNRDEAIRRLEMAIANVEEVLDAVASRRDLPEETLALPADPTEMVTLRFIPQAWIRDYAVTVDSENPATWEVPLTLVLGRFPLESDWSEWDEERDAMRFEGNAPKWIRDWSGPFEVELAASESPWSRGKVEGNLMDTLLCRGLVLNRPEIFADPAFRAWLANGTPKFTWCAGGAVDEWSDVIVLVDPALTGEGSDSDMPATIWEHIIAMCHEHLGAAGPGHAHYIVRLTNLAE